MDIVINPIQKMSPRVGKNDTSHFD